VISRVLPDGRAPERGHYGPAQLLGDCSGGVIAALIALPYGLAMASLMGLPPVLGVFTSILTAPLIALFGRNPVLIGGTASATVPFIALAVRQHGIAGAATLSILAAVFMLLFATLRLGRHIALVPHPVVSGFSCGIGVMMILSQFGVLLGIAHPGRIALGLAVIVVATLAARLSPHAPAPLIGVAAAVVIARVFHLTESEIGALPAAWPRVVVTSWATRDVLSAIPPAFALAFVSSVNILITSRVVEHFRGRHRRMAASDADAELRAYGAANFAAGFFGAPMSVGIPARSLAVVRCGGTTPVANVVHAVVLIAILWLGSGFVAHIPIPALAGVTAWMGLCLLNWSEWRRLPRMNRVDAAAFLATVMAVVTVNAVFAVAIGCSLYMWRALWTRVVRPARVAEASAR
jgi:sulfate permease, SulP family